MVAWRPRRDHGRACLGRIGEGFNFRDHGNACKQVSKGSILLPGPALVQMPLIPLVTPSAKIFCGTPPMAIIEQPVFAAKLQALQLVSASQAALQASGDFAPGLCTPLSVMRAVFGWLASGMDSNNEAFTSVVPGLCTFSVKATAGVMLPL